MIFSRLRFAYVNKPGWRSTIGRVDLVYIPHSSYIVIASCQRIHVSEVTNRSVSICPSMQNSQQILYSQQELCIPVVRATCVNNQMRTVPLVTTSSSSNLDLD